MQTIKSKAELAQVVNNTIRASIALHMQTLSQQYAEPYQATQHGWFIVCEDECDVLMPFLGLSFSLAEKLQSGEVEFVDKKQDWYEVYILLNDNEGILIYVPTSLLTQYHSLRI